MANPSAPGALLVDDFGTNLAGLYRTAAPETSVAAGFARGAGGAYLEGTIEDRIS